MTLRRQSLRIAVCLLALATVVTASTNALVRWISPPGPMWLDPRHLPGKAMALLFYARHRAGCAVFADDGDVLRLSRRAAINHHVAPELFEALVRTESSGLAHRISPTGAMGPAQLTWATARTLGVDDPFAPAETTDAGARYLASLLARYRGDTHLAVAAYNAGPHAVTDCIPQNGETELYVPRVLALHARLRGLTRREATRSRR